MSLTEDLESVSEQFLAVVGAAQDFALRANATVVEALKPVTERLAALPLSVQVPDAAGVVSVGFEFAGKLLGEQKAFAEQLLGAYQPAAAAPKTAARTAKAA